MTDDRFLPDWDERAIELGKPEAMDTPTLIEWIQRQLECPDATKLRHSELRLKHLLWHESHPGIYACCISAGRISLMSG